ncbi:hypothetical protein GCM10022295_28800 [Streptomyces osmaniensis]|uniref:Uncharacterized protein n=1 Tax=Streptomyces osmaniensis TaxID=593134 RepID=A0ABP6W5W2_9ACTN
MWDAESGFRQLLGAEGESEVVAARGGRLGGLGLAGDDEWMAAEDGDRGGADVQAGDLATDDRDQRGRVVGEGLAEPCGTQSGLLSFARELHRGVDPVVERKRCSNGHDWGNPRAGDRPSECRMTSGRRVTRRAAVRLALLRPLRPGSW